MVTLVADKLETGYERLTFGIEDCIRQPKRQLPSSSYNHNTLKTLITSVIPETRADGEYGAHWGEGRQAPH